MIDLINTPETKITRSLATNEMGVYSTINLINSWDLAVL